MLLRQNCVLDRCCDKAYAKAVLKAVPKYYIIIFRKDCSVLGPQEVPIVQTLRKLPGT
jgi:hypothetical protein